MVKNENGPLTLLTFGKLLDLANLGRGDVRLLRHQDNHIHFPSPYILWRDHRDRFDAYQATQVIGDAARLRAPYWASFVSMAERETLFVGMYSARFTGLLAEDRIHPITGGIQLAGSCHLYQLELKPELSEYAGRLWIEWGDGYRAWIQRGDRIEKPVLELRRSLREDPSPAFNP